MFSLKSLYCFYFFTFKLLVFYFTPLVLTFIIIFKHIKILLNQLCKYSYYYSLNHFTINNIINKKNILSTTIAHIGCEVLGTNLFLERKDPIPIAMHPPLRRWSPLLLNLSKKNNSKTKNHSDKKTQLATQIKLCDQTVSILPKTLKE